MFDDPVEFPNGKIKYLTTVTAETLGLDDLLLVDLETSDNGIVVLTKNQIITFDLISDKRAPYVGNTVTYTLPYPAYKIGLLQQGWEEHLVVVTRNAVFEIIWNYVSPRIENIYQSEDDLSIVRQAAISPLYIAVALENRYIVFSRTQKDWVQTPLNFEVPNPPFLRLLNNDFVYLITNTFTTAFSLQAPHA